MSDTEDIQREQTGESQPDEEERGEVQTTSGESEADHNSDSETETAVSEYEAEDTKDIQREQTGESHPDDEERQRRQKELNKKLVKAANDGNNEDVIRHIRDGAEITSRDRYGGTGLHLSAFRGHKDVLQTFINHNADLNIRVEAQGTPLIIAAANGQLSCAQLLLAHEADSDLQSESGRTALMWAAQRNNLDIIASLLAHGANDQIQDNDGWDALEFAEVYNNQEAITMLQAWKEKEKSNVSQEMMKAFVEECLQKCEEDKERQRRQEELNRKLVKAAGAGKNEDVIQHISDGAEITSRDSNGFTGLHLSAQEGHKDVLQTFITHKADLNIQGFFYQRTPLFYAAGRGQLSCAQLLLANGADTDLQDVSWMTALMEAAQRNNPDIISALLAHGADSKIQDNRGWDALKWAMRYNSQDAIRMLQAWKEKSNDSQENYLKLDAIRIFTSGKERSNISQEMMTAAAEGKWRLVTGLIIAGADVETRNAQGETGLDLAIRSGNRDAVLTFLDKGVNGYNREECLQKCNDNKERQMRQLM